MRRAMLVALGTGAIIGSAAAFSIGASEGSGTALTQEQYEGKVRALQAARTARAARCDAATGFEREFCRIELDAEHAVRIADVEAAYRRSREATRAAQRARIEARYQVERAKCGALGGFKRDKCLVQVHATRGRAMLHAAAPYEVRF
jgi:hyperosmotically inducible periplasmic protein